LISVREARPSDVAALAALHVESFKGFFLSRLGPRFVGELYRGFVESPDAVCVVAFQNADVVGIAAGPIDPRVFFRRLLLKRGYRFALAALPVLARHPWEVGQRLLGALLYRGEAPPRYACAALLSTICVHPSSQGTGVARVLLERFCAVAATGGARYAYLTTDRDDNQSVNAFYVRAGFSLTAEVRRSGGRIMNCYLRQIG
jgi:GNAT superfamily N-acetyltransferase